MVDWSEERAGARRWGGLVAGVDEAGRGPIAGPVVAAAVVLPESIDLETLDDSKRLTPTRRARAFASICACGSVAWALAEPHEIDRHNILRASLRAMARALALLAPQPAGALIDGPHAPPWPGPSVALAGGDGRCASIAAASIVAKVVRDRLMAQACARFSSYDFSRHKGYPTKAHQDALRAHGPCPAHRRSFAPVRDVYASATEPDSVGRESRRSAGALGGTAP